MAGDEPVGPVVGPDVPKRRVTASGQDPGPDAPALSHGLGDGHAEFELQQRFHVDDEEADEAAGQARRGSVLASQPNSSGKASSTAPEMPPWDPHRDSGVRLGRAQLDPALAGSSQISFVACYPG